ncbi:DUF58 domain-containing protein [Brevibacillus humidisoli]|uniref:DUF58 domain-containing protein n=1 Tax=Brevibacillus humidisoli TaxID=2895522 RepID=UPI001E5840C8|nr:DUF58 domain-containing protein [Brevibacillus humidisoli]UFJ40889.1 DUF58 domain-containing protein [Brevibacillus humidisoli]
MGARQLYQLFGSLFLFFGLISGEWFLWLLGGFFFFVVVWHRWWKRNLPRWISISCQADGSRVMPGTAVRVRLVLGNRSWFPLPYTTIRFTLPEHVLVEGADKLELQNKRHVIQLWLSVPRRSQVERSITLIPQKRGIVWLTAVETELIGSFWPESIQTELRMPFSLLVYPALLPIPSVSFGDTEPLGRRLSRQRVQDDSAFIRGIRPYQGGDRLKLIDWKASAKTQSLKTRQLEYTSQPHWLILGHILPSYEPLLQKHNDGLNERTISTLASAAVQCRRSGLPYELWINVKWRGKEFLQFAKGSGKAHHVQVMTQLAQLHLFAPGSLLAVLRRLEQSREKQAILLISPRLDEVMMTALERLARRGHELVILDTSDEVVALHRIGTIRSHGAAGGALR